jgi:DNA-binding NarL/FixJ family response regulator
VIEDDPEMREALALDINRSPGLHCSGVAPAFEDCELSLKFGTDADVIVLDYHLPGGMEGAEAARALKKFPRLKVLVLSFDEDPSKILEALGAGVDGYLLKSAPREELADGIRRVHAGNFVMSQKVANAVGQFFRCRQPLFLALSPTERKILELLDTGLTHKEAANKLGISVETMKTHVKRIIEKMCANSITQAAWLRKQFV